MLSLQHRLSLQQKLSPQQIQYQKLLQLNTLALEQRIKTELELNPILEETLDEEIDLEQLEETPDEAEEKTTDEDETYDSKDDEFDLEDYMNESESEQELDRLNRRSDEDTIQPIAPQRKTLRENLVDQLRMLDLSDDEISLGENIIGSLDRDGYFKADLVKIV
ncbi:MAG: RNA polymerase sigma-54 factor, partial [Ignavibacteria bacterium]|nr:RNA polymerase sigma-54 factor [Ignavibacteria bacterium]